MHQYVHRFGVQLLQNPPLSSSTTNGFLSVIEMKGLVEQNGKIPTDGAEEGQNL